ncbi:hypothetical protein [Lederbergia ruris]|uniref:Uncharacterized protein n=1 Tax=Lederbergia ruris TaxID=217495 RepID=A0ABQ4KKX7_9BACI|nr:hypothetical protein [Lederbergia ruris]GIN57804.1 hypothetical protein J8TS2_21230 [Lederbergia ruris]
MSLKLIELQVALPRTMEAGKITEQLQQRGQVMSEQAREEAKDKIEQERQRINQLDENDEVRLRKEDGSSKEQKEHHSSLNKREQVAEKKPSNEKHPYKGKRIDYSG